MDHACPRPLRTLHRAVIALLGIALLSGCVARPQIQRLAPYSSVEPAELMQRTPLRMIRVAKLDRNRVTLFAPRLEGDTLTGVWDAGPPVKVPLDSIVYVEAYLVRSRYNTVSAGEWLRLGALVTGLVTVGACVVNLCPPFVGRTE